MAKIPNGIETLPKISIAYVGCTNVTDDRQTDVPPVHVGSNHVDTDKLITTTNGGTFTSSSATVVSVANHVKARQSLIQRAVIWLTTESGWARSKHSAICNGKLCGGFIIFEQCCPCVYRMAVFKGRRMHLHHELGTSIAPDKMPLFWDRVYSRRVHFMAWIYTRNVALHIPLWPAPRGKPETPWSSSRPYSVSTFGVGIRRRRQTEAATRTGRRGSCRERRRSACQTRDAAWKALLKDLYRVKRDWMLEAALVWLQVQAGVREVWARETVLRVHLWRLARVVLQSTWTSRCPDQRSKEYVFGFIFNMRYHSI